MIVPKHVMKGVFIGLLVGFPVNCVIAGPIIAVIAIAEVSVAFGLALVVKRQFERYEQRKLLPKAKVIK